MKNNVHLFRMVNGEFVVAEVVNENDGRIVVRRPLMLVATPARSENPGTGTLHVMLVPWMVGHASGPFEEIVVYGHAVAARTRPEKELLDEYIRATTGVIIPTLVNS